MHIDICMQFSFNPVLVSDHSFDQVYLLTIYLGLSHSSSFYDMNGSNNKSFTSHF